MISLSVVFEVQPVLCLLFLIALITCYISEKYRLYHPDEIYLTKYRLETGTNDLCRRHLSGLEGFYFPSEINNQSRISSLSLQ